MTGPLVVHWSAKPDGLLDSCTLHYCWDSGHREYRMELPDKEK